MKDSWLGFFGLVFSLILQINDGFLGPNSTLRRTCLFSSATNPVVELAQNQVDKLRETLGSTPPPPELIKLEADIKRDASKQELGLSMFNLLITMTLDYDNVDGYIEPALDLPEILPQSEDMRQKMTYLYTYGMRMNASDLLSLGDLKDTILNRMAKRVGLSGEDLDNWLDV
mmetsp:Transcript_20261/g.26228  ORF Transcript_20261/g.26228 Transcript_20261/m.26228 type:complete len:172 (-) Transcript_20261:54-569(-)